MCKLGLNCKWQNRFSKDRNSWVVICCQVCVDGAPRWQKAVKTLQFNVRIPDSSAQNSVQSDDILHFLSGGWRSALWIRQMQGGPWKCAWHCGYCGHISQPGGSGVSVCLYTCLMCLWVDFKCSLWLLDGTDQYWSLSNWWMDERTTRGRGHKSFVCIQRRFYLILWM